MVSELTLKFYKEPTNGNILRELFPDEHCEVREWVVLFSFGGVTREIPIGWWNKRYERIKK